MKQTLRCCSKRTSRFPKSDAHLSSAAATPSSIRPPVPTRDAISASTAMTGQRIVPRHQQAPPVSTGFSQQQQLQPFLSRSPVPPPQQQPQQQAVTPTVAAHSSSVSASQTPSRNNNTNQQVHQPQQQQAQLSSSSSHDVRTPPPISRTVSSSSSFSSPLASAAAEKRTTTSSSTSSSKKTTVQLEQELTRAQLRIAQLLSSTHSLPWYQQILDRLDATDRAFHRTASETRYTQMALTATHDALRQNVEEVLGEITIVTRAMAAAEADHHRAAGCGVTSNGSPSDSSSSSSRQNVELAMDLVAVRSGARRLLKECNAYRPRSVQQGGVIITETPKPTERQ